MGTFINFLYEFIGVFIKGIVTIIKGIVTGFIMMFNFPEYLKVFNFYKREFTVSGWILAIITALVVLVLLALVILLIVFLVKKFLD